METSVVTSKGQIVIPARLRQRAGIKRGTRVYLEERGGDIIVHPATSDFYDRTFGVLKGEELVQTLEKNRRRDHESEKRAGK